MSGILNAAKYTSRFLVAPKYEAKILVLMSPKNADKRKAAKIKAAAEKTFVCLALNTFKPLFKSFLNTAKLYHPCNPTYNSGKMIISLLNVCKLLI